MSQWLGHRQPPSCTPSTPSLGTISMGLLLSVLLRILWFVCLRVWARLILLLLLYLIIICGFHRAQYFFQHLPNPQQTNNPCLYLILGSMYLQAVFFHQQGQSRLQKEQKRIKAKKYYFAPLRHYRMIQNKKGQIQRRLFLLYLIRLIRQWATTHMLILLEFLIIGLSATPGNDHQRIQQVLQNLQISNMIVKSDQDPDVKKYIKNKKIQPIFIPNTSIIREVELILQQFISWPLKTLLKMRLFDKNLASGKFGFNPKCFYQINNQINQRISSLPFKLISLAQSAKIFLKFVADSQTILREAGYESFKRKFIYQIEDIQPQNTLMQKLMPQRSRVNQNFLKIVADHPGYKRIKELFMSSSNPVNHPKLQKLRDILYNFLNQKQNISKKSKVIIFANLRFSCYQIHKYFSQQPYNSVIKSEIFLGQAKTTVQVRDGQNSKTQTLKLSQKDQINLIKRYKNNQVNTLISTSIGEQGLDIGQVDAIFCYQGGMSTIRMIQRMGRTGRKRDGTVYILLMEGKQSQDYEKALKKTTKMKKANSYKYKYYSFNPVLFNQYSQIPIIFFDKPKQTQQQTAAKEKLKNQANQSQKATKKKNKQLQVSQKKTKRNRQPKPQIKIQQVSNSQQNDSYNQKHEYEQKQKQQQQKSDIGNKYQSHWQKIRKQKRQKLFKIRNDQYIRPTTMQSSQEQQFQSPKFGEVEQKPIKIQNDKYTQQIEQAQQSTQSQKQDQQDQQRKHNPKFQNQYSLYSNIQRQNQYRQIQQTSNSNTSVDIYAQPVFSKFAELFDLQRLLQSDNIMGKQDQNANYRQKQKQYNDKQQQNSHLQNLNYTNFSPQQTKKQSIENQKQEQKQSNNITQKFQQENINKMDNIKISKQTNQNNQQSDNQNALSNCNLYELLYGSAKVDQVTQATYCDDDINLLKYCTQSTVSNTQRNKQDRQDCINQVNQICQANDQFQIDQQLLLQQYNKLKKIQAKRLISQPYGIIGQQADNLKKAQECNDSGSQSLNSSELINTQQLKEHNQDQ